MEKSFYKETVSPTGAVSRVDLGRQFQQVTGGDLNSLPQSRTK